MDRNTDLQDFDTTTSYAGIGTNLMYLLIGGGIGATLALLFAPKPGSELRQDISNVAQKGYDETLELAEKIKDQSTQLYETIRTKADQFYDFAAEKFNLENVESPRQIINEVTRADQSLESGQSDMGNTEIDSSRPLGNIH